MRPTIDIAVRPSHSLSRAELDEIWTLTERYVEADRGHYESKLLALPEVGLWRVRGGELAGLVSLDVYTTQWQDRAHTIIFTSSVVADERFRGRNLVLKTGLRLLLREKVRRPLVPAYWFFDTFSYKSYLILARNLREYWPKRGTPTSPDTAAFINELATRRYGPDWDRTRGVVRRSGYKRLHSTAAPIDERLQSDPDVRFFETLNPGHREGDMLVCLAPLTLGNLAGAVMRMRRFAR